MGNLAKAAAGRSIQAAKPAEGIQGYLEKAWPRIRAVMPKHMSSERLYQLALSAVNTTPKLAECDPATILSCVMKCSALGLEPSAVDGLGRAYILPYRNRDKRTGGTRMEATFILGYKGMLDLARRSGKVRDISARAVYEGDEFEFEFGLDEKLSHRPASVPHTPETLTHVYCVCHFADGGHYADVMAKAEVDAVRKRSKASESGPWVTDYEAMAKKTVIRRAFPYLPVSVEAQTAAASDETDGGFVQAIGFAPVAPEACIGAGAEPSADSRLTGVCRGCGHVVEDVAADATADDLNGVGCCPEPDYEIKEA